MPPETSAPKLFARDIIAYSDAELDRYLEENNRIVDVEDPDNLPDEFIQRLKDRTHAVSEIAKSHPADPDQLAARLQDVSANQARSRRSPSAASSALSTIPPLTDEEQYRQDLRWQTGYYKMLVDDGGRPSHPLTRLEDIVENPGEYREILTFWQGKYADPDEDEWRVFGTQLGRWKDFRGLQRFARGQRGYDYWRSIWEENRKMGTLEHPEMPALGSPELERDWQRNQDDHDNYVRSGTSYIPWKLFIDKTTDQQGFPEYAEALKGRLARHGFTRPFQLDEDAAQQDKITTWIEYLGYEYWWYDYHVDIITHYQKRHDDAWNKLVESKVLRPGETEEVVCDTNRIFQDWGELKTSEKAIESAVSAVSSAETAVAEWREESKLSLQTLQQQLFAARSQLEAAQAEDEPLQTRSNHISEFMQRTMTYQIATDDANHHSKLLPWMLQQVPLIEAEMNPSNERDSDKRGKSVVLKRNHSQSEELNEDDQQQSRSEGVSNHNADRQVPVAISSQEPPSMRPKRTTRLSNNLTKGTLVPKRACKPRKCQDRGKIKESGCRNYNHHTDTETNAFALNKIKPSTP